MRWGHARDRGDWDTLKNCFHPDGTIHIAWIQASGYEFVEKSAARLSEFGEGEYEKHVFSPPHIQLNGPRAYTTIHAQHITRVIVEGIEFDWDFWGQFHDLVEKRDDEVWRLFSRTIVYERDRLDPVHPEKIPPGYFDDVDFGEFRQPVRFLDWRLSKKGIPAAKSILTINSPEEAALIADSLTWLKGD